jgi:hypothetical protein
MKEIKYTISYCVFVRTFVIPYYYGSGTVINYGSDSNFLTSYGSASGSGTTRQKVTVPTVPFSVPQNCPLESCSKHDCFPFLLYLDMELMYKCPSIGIPHHPARSEILRLTIGFSTEIYFMKATVVYKNILLEKS